MYRHRRASTVSTPQRTPGRGAGGTCSVCSLPAELCVCEDLDREGATLSVQLDTRRYGKAVTVIRGFPDTDAAKRTGKELKKALATGGTAKDHQVELQGDHQRDAKRLLEKKGYRVD